LEDIAVSLFGLQYRLRVVSLRESGTFMRRLRSRSEKVVLLKLPGSVGEYPKYSVAADSGLR
jgi:hypothetical protein